MLFLGKKPQYMPFTHGALWAKRIETDEKFLKIIIYNGHSAKGVFSGL